MTGKQNAVFGLLFGALLAGQACYWFIGGEYMEHSTIRNVLVVMQLAVGLGTMGWFVRKARSGVDNS
jgi:hypothetical protein